MKKIEYTTGSENVFADLGINEPEEYLQKANLAVRINDILVEGRLTQVKAAELLRVDQPKISLLKRGILDAFSIERLMRFLRILGDPHDPSYTKAHSRGSLRPGGKTETIEQEISLAAQTIDELMQTV